MTEILEIYDLNSNYLYDQDRKEFYDSNLEEFGKTGVITRKAQRVSILVMNSENEIIFQKRSLDKKQNPGMYDKSIGGHVSKGFGFDQTALKESEEELGVKALLIDKRQNLKDFLDESKTHLILQEIEHIETYLSKRFFNNNRYEQPFIQKTYLGLYNGEVSFTDGEVDSVIYLEYHEALKRINDEAQSFTEDIKHMLKHYQAKLMELSSGT